MFLLSFLPDSFLQFIVHTVLILGIFGTIISFAFLNKTLMAFPSISAYYKTLQITSIVLLILGIYFEGGYTNEMMWRGRVKEIEARVQKAELESKNSNKKLEKISKAKVKIVREKGLVIKQYVDREVTKYDSSCSIPQAVVKSHNAAARNEDVK